MIHFGFQCMCLVLGSTTQLNIGSKGHLRMTNVQTTSQTFVTMPLIYAIINDYVLLWHTVFIIAHHGFTHGHLAMLPSSDMVTRDNEGNMSMLSKAQHAQHWDRWGRGYMVGSCYGMVNFLHNTHDRYPIDCPWGWNMGCLVVYSK